MSTLTKDVYAYPAVKEAIQKAKDRHEKSLTTEDGEEHFTVWAGRSVPAGLRIFVVRQGESLRHLQNVEPVFDTEEGEYLE